MSSKSRKASRTTESKDMVLQKTHDIPVHITDLSVFDDSFAVLRERFTAEMKRVDEEMMRFSTNLTHFLNQPVTMQAGVTSGSEHHATWEEIASSPLIHGDGENKTLKLQFDVSQFTPEEVKVNILNNTLTITAAHEEKTNSSATNKHYNRDFLLPPGTITDSVVSSVSRDGVLVIQIPLPAMAVQNTPVQKPST